MKVCNSFASHGHNCPTRGMYSRQAVTDTEIHSNSDPNGLLPDDVEPCHGERKLD